MVDSHPFGLPLVVEYWRRSDRRYNSHRGGFNIGQPLPLFYPGMIVIWVHQLFVMAPLDSRGGPFVAQDLGSEGFLLA